MTGGILSLIILRLYWPAAPAWLFIVLAALIGALQVRGGSRFVALGADGVFVDVGTEQCQFFPWEHVKYAAYRRGLGGLALQVNHKRICLGKRYFTNIHQCDEFLKALHAAMREHENIASPNELT